MADAWLDSLLELQTLIDNEEYQKSVDLSKQIVDIQDIPQSVRTLIYECLATSLLHLQQYQTVVDLSPKDVSEDSDLPLLHAYALYRLERYHQAKVLLQEQTSTATSSTSKLLLAQVQYHLHETKEALQLYNSLLQNGEDEARTEILTNALATIVADATPQIRDQASKTEADALQQLAMDTLQDDDYDGWYNLSTWLHLTGTPSRAMLERARHACIHALSQVEGISTTERNKEVAPMETNVAWSQQWSGQTASPTTALPNDSLPASVVTIRALNDALAIGGGGGSGDNQRGLKALLAVQIELPSWPLLHQRLWWYNCAVLQLRVNSVDNCRKNAKSLQATLRKKGGTGKKDSDEESTTSRWWWQSRLDVLEALCLSKEGKQQKAVDLVKESLTKLKTGAKASPSETLDHALAHLQLHLFQLEHGETKEAASANNTKEKISLLEGLPPSIRSQRAVVATLVSLHQAQGNTTEASNLLQHDELAFADFCIAQSNYNEAIDFLQKRIADLDKSKSNSNKKSILQAKLVEVLSYVDPSRAQQALSQLSPGGADDDDEWNGEELEEREIPRSLATAAWKQQQTVGLIESKQNKNKNSREASLRRRANKRKEYLKELEKKGLYNPNHPAQPDPERWIPKHQRSSSRRKGRKGGDVHRGAQGGASEKDAAKLDVAARQAALAKGEVDANGPSTAHMTVSSSGMTRRAGRRR